MSKFIESIDCKLLFHLFVTSLEDIIHNNIHISIVNNERIGSFNSPWQKLHRTQSEVLTPLYREHREVVFVINEI